VTPEQIRAYCNRDWALIARSKSSYYAERRLTPAQRLQMAAELYESARSRRPEWPTLAERDADFAAHVRLSEKLGALQVRPR